MAYSKKYYPEVRERTVRMVFDNESEYASQWEAIRSIASYIDFAVLALELFRVLAFAEIAEVRPSDACSS